MGESIDYWVSLCVYRSIYSIESLMSWRHGREDRYRRVVCCLPKKKMDGWMDGWVDGWMVGNILVRIPPSTPTSCYIFYIFFFFFFVVIWELLGVGESLDCDVFSAFESSANLAVFFLLSVNPISRGYGKKERIKETNKLSTQPPPALFSIVCVSRGSTCHLVEKFSSISDVLYVSIYICRHN